MVGAYVVIGAALAEAVGVERDHFGAALTGIAGEGRLVLVVWTKRITCIVVGVVPNIAGTRTYAVIMKVYEASQTSCACEVAGAVGAGRYAGLAGCALKGVGLGRAIGHADIVVEVGTYAFGAVTRVSAGCAVRTALGAGETVDWVVENRAGGKTKAVELDQGRSALEAVVVS